MVVKRAFATIAPITPTGWFRSAKQDPARTQSPASICNNRPRGPSDLKTMKLPRFARARARRLVESPRELLRVIEQASRKQERVLSTLSGSFFMWPKGPFFSLSFPGWPQEARPYAVPRHRPSVRRRSCPGQNTYGPARDRGTRGDEAGRRGQPRARARRLGIDYAQPGRRPPWDVRGWHQHRKPTAHAQRAA